VKRAAEHPRVLAAAGLDPSGRAGLVADVGAIAAAGGAPLAVATAVTAQGRRFLVSPVPDRVLDSELEAVLELGRPGSVKVGMVPGPGALAVLWRRLAGLGVPVVVDPVVRTSRGERLSRLAPGDYRRLAGPWTWLVPNAPELGWLLGRSTPRSLGEAKEMAATLLAEGFRAVVLKGGHLPGAPVDLLALPDRLVAFRGPRLSPRPEARGTGCRFASTLATRLALGDGAEAAVRSARRAVRRYLGGRVART